MADTAFPTVRFLEAGGTAEEVAQLEKEYNKSDLGGQQALSDFWASVAMGDLVEYVTDLRDQGHFNPDETIVDHDASETEKDDAEPVAPVTIPASIEGATAFAGNKGAPSTPQAPATP